MMSIDCDEEAEVLGSALAEERMEEHRRLQSYEKLAAEKAEAVHIIAVMLHHMDLTEMNSLGVGLVKDRARAFLAKQETSE